MAIRTILEVPDPCLKTVSEPVDAFDEELHALVDDMFETMYDAPGIGLAAIQVGVPKRVLVIDLQEPDGDRPPEACGGETCGHDHRPGRRDPRVFVNPEIVETSDELSTYNEGCLSIPEIYAEIERPKTCRVRYQDVDGEWHAEALDGLLATCLQHEVDHLNGVLFIDRLSRLKRGMAMKKLTKLRQAA